MREFGGNACRPDFCRFGKFESVLDLSARDTMRHAENIRLGWQNDLRRGAQ